MRMNIKMLDKRNGKDRKPCLRVHIKRFIG